MLGHLLAIGIWSLVIPPIRASAPLRSGPGLAGRNGENEPRVPPRLHGDGSPKSSHDLEPGVVQRVNLARQPCPPDGACDEAGGGVDALADADRADRACRPAD